MINLLKLFEEFLIIPSIKQRKELDLFFKTRYPIGLISDSHIGNLKALSELYKKHNKKVLVNTELLGGFLPDKTGLKLLKNMYYVDGIISSNAQVINMSKSVGLFTVERFFLLDSVAFNNVLKTLTKSSADVVELLPSLVAYDYHKTIVDACKKPILVGGFINSRERVKLAENLKFSGVTTSSQNAWL